MREIIFAHDLVGMAIRIAKPQKPLPRWAVVKRVFGTGRQMSITICHDYGYDPEEIVYPTEEPLDDY